MPVVVDEALTLALALALALALVPAGESLSMLSAISVTRPSYSVTSVSLRRRCAIGCCAGVYSDPEQTGGWRQAMRIAVGKGKADLAADEGVG